jgi:hypothetical protein
MDAVGRPAEKPRVSGVYLFDGAVRGGAGRPELQASYYPNYAYLRPEIQAAYDLRRDYCHDNRLLVQPREGACMALPDP